MSQSIDIKAIEFDQCKRLMKRAIEQLFHNLGDEQSDAVRMERIELPVVWQEMVDWLEHQKFEQKIYGSDQTRTFAIAGVGSAYQVRCDQLYDLEEVFAHLKTILNPKYPHMQLYGGLAFDRSRMSNDWQAFGQLQFFIPQFELAAKDHKMIFACNICLTGDQSQQCEQVLNLLESINSVEARNDVPVGSGDSRVDEPNHSQWCRNVQEVIQRIEQEEVQKVVLARRTRIKSGVEFSATALLKDLVSIAPQSYVFLFQPKSGHAFIGASPERLYQRQGHDLRSVALAGTRRRGVTKEEDAMLKEELKNSAKDKVEHQYVVDAICKELRPLSKSVEITSLQQIMTVHNGHHIYSTIEAELFDDITDSLLISRLHPTPAVGGSPRAKAMSLVRQYETFDRGWYAGLIGFIGLDQVEFVVAIRSCLIQNHEVDIFAGAGVVKNSLPESEWMEVEGKIDHLLRIVQ